jgi:hypothetical protein
MHKLEGHTSKITLSDPTVKNLFNLKFNNNLFNNLIIIFMRNFTYPINLRSFCKHFL